MPIYLATARKATWSNSCIICITVYRNQLIIRTIMNMQPGLVSDNRLIWHNGNRKNKKSLRMMRLKYQFIICGLKGASAKLMITSNWIILLTLVLTFLLISHNLRRKNGINLLTLLYFRTTIWSDDGLVLGLKKNNSSTDALIFYLQVAMAQCNAGLFCQCKLHSTCYNYF